MKTESKGKERDKECLNTFCAEMRCVQAWSFFPTLAIKLHQEKKLQNKKLPTDLVLLHFPVQYIVQSRTYVFQNSFQVLFNFP